MTTATTNHLMSSSEAEERKREVFALQAKLPLNRLVDNNSNNTNDEDDDVVVITSFLLESTLVPALKDWIKDQEENDSLARKNPSTRATATRNGSASGTVDRSSLLVEERKDARDTLPGINNHNDVDKESPIDSEKNDRTRYAEAILECLVSFVEGTCAPNSKFDVVPSPQQGSYNSLSFKRNSSNNNNNNNNSSSSNASGALSLSSPLSSSSSQKFKTPGKKASHSQSRSRSRSLSTPKEDKAFFVTCGAFEMAVHLLRRVLEDHTRKVSSTSWSRHKRDSLDTFDSIGVEDSIANVQIESTLPADGVPILVIRILACLSHNASDALKTDRILPLLGSIVHKAMMVFLPCAELQKYGCWTLSSLSNPLLQELVAAGSVSMLVKTMQCHPCEAGVQEHGNNALYNLLPLLVACYKGQKNKKKLNGTTKSQPHTNSMNMNMNMNMNMPSPLLSGDPGASTTMSSSSFSSTSTSQAQGFAAMGAMEPTMIAIDGKQLEDYSSLLPSLPAIVLRGMEEHPDHLAVQQYGLLVLTRLCQQDQETYEIVVSEGGLNALLAVVSMATTHAHTYSNSKAPLTSADTTATAHSSIIGGTQSISERHDCLAQMACQFLRDLSRPTNSSMDILRIIAVKGGTQTVLGVLDHYNREHVRGGHVYHNHHNRFAVNIIDPAMACLRNLMTNEDNRSEIMTLSGMAKASGGSSSSSSPKTKQGGDRQQQQQQQQQPCVNIIPIVLTTMDLYPQDAAIQAYGCDLLGRLTQGEESARMELIESTILGHTHHPQQRDGHEHEHGQASSEEGDGITPGQHPELQQQQQQQRTFGNHSRLWKRSGETTTTTNATTLSPSGDDSQNVGDDLEQIDLESRPSEEGAEFVDLSDRFGTAGPGHDGAQGQGPSESSPAAAAVGAVPLSPGGYSATATTTASNNTWSLDSLVTVVRAMRNHRTHSGVQERSVVLLLAMVLDRSSSSPTSASSSQAPSASSYLIQRLREVYEAQRDADAGEPATLLAFLQTATVTPKGIDRWKKLMQVVEDYDRKTKRASVFSASVASPPRQVGSFFARRWNKLAGGGPDPR